MRTLPTAKRNAARHGIRRGAMLVIVCFFMIGFMLTVAISIDLSHVHLARMELRSATDAAAKAAAQELSQAEDAATAIARGKEIASENPVINKPLLLRDSDFVFGQSVFSPATNGFVFTAGQRPFNSVRVTGQRTANSPSGPVPLFFGGFWQSSGYDARSSAIATFMQRDIVLVVDRSGSMAGTKIADLAKSINTFSQVIKKTPAQERIGLASYSSDATIDTSLTTDVDAVIRRGMGLIVGGATNITGGMDAGDALFRSSEKTPFSERFMVVMTDGQHNVGPLPIGSAERIAREKIVIHTITFGVDANQSLMQQVSTIGKGKHFHADNGAELQAAFREIALSLTTMMTE